MEILSQAPSNAYQSFTKAKKKKNANPKRRIASLPRHIRDNLGDIQFGVGTLPSDNMNMVMTHEFEHAFLSKMKQKQTIENEMERIASL